MSPLRLLIICVLSLKNQLLIVYDIGGIKTQKKLAFQITSK